MATFNDPRCNKDGEDEKDKTLRPFKVFLLVYFMTLLGTLMVRNLETAIRLHVATSFIMLFISLGLTFKKRTELLGVRIVLNILLISLIVIFLLLMLKLV